jgi:hypothetical protein
MPAIFLLQIRLRIPPLLKKVVLDDYEGVAQRGRALPLPRSAHGRPSVAQVRQRRAIDVPPVPQGCR